MGNSCCLTALGASEGNNKDASSGPSRSSDTNQTTRHRQPLPPHLEIASTMATLRHQVPQSHKAVTGNNHDTNKTSSPSSQMSMHTLPYTPVLESITCTTTTSSNSGCGGGGGGGTSSSNSSHFVSVSTFSSGCSGGEQLQPVEETSGAVQCSLPTMDERKTTRHDGGKDPIVDEQEEEERRRHRQGSDIRACNVLAPPSSRTNNNNSNLCATTAAMTAHLRAIEQSNSSANSSSSSMCGGGGGGGCGDSGTFFLFQSPPNGSLSAPEGLSARRRSTRQSSVVFSTVVVRVNDGSTHGSIADAPLVGSASSTQSLRLMSSQRGGDSAAAGGAEQQLRLETSLLLPVVDAASSACDHSGGSPLLLLPSSTTSTVLGAADSSGTSLTSPHNNDKDVMPSHPDAPLVMQGAAHVVKLISGGMLHATRMQRQSSSMRQSSSPPTQSPRDSISSSSPFSMVAFSLAPVAQRSIKSTPDAAVAPLPVVDHDDGSESHHHLGYSDGADELEKSCLFTSIPIPVPPPPPPT